MSSNSQLIVQQFNREFQVKKPWIQPNLNLVRDLASRFKSIEVRHIPWEENSYADALANLATSTLRNTPWIIPLLEAKWSAIKVLNGVVTCPISLEETSWTTSLKDYIRYGNLPKDWLKVTQVQTRAVHFVILDRRLYWKSFEGRYRKCLEWSKGKLLLNGLHVGEYRNYSGTRSLIRRTYTWDFFGPR